MGEIRGWACTKTITVTTAKGRNRPSEKNNGAKAIGRNIKAADGVRV